MKVFGVIVVFIVLLLAAAWLAVRGPDIPYETLEAKYTDGASRFVDLPGGFHVHYQDDGDPDSPLLVLLHGFGDSYTSWEGWVAALKGQFHIISLDFPGHGLTRAPAGYEMSADGLADFVATFAGRLALPKFAVAGNSLGGAVAWKLAVRYPQRVNALILADAAGFPNEKTPGKTPLAFKILGYSWGRALLRNIDNRPVIDAGLKFDVYDQSIIRPRLVDRWADFQRAPGHRAILMSVNFGGLNQATPEVLGGISVPTLVLHGDDDPLIEPASGAKFAAAIPGATLVTYAHVGHLPQLEIPQRSAADVGKFLQSVH